MAFKINLFSAVFACLTAVTMYAAGIRLLTLLEVNGLNVFWKTWAASIPAATLAFSLPFWSHAVVAEVYTLHLFFTMLLIWFLLVWKETDDIRFLYAGALIYGLSAGNHATVAFYLPAILILFFLWNREETFRRLTVAAACFLVGLSVYAYLPVRSVTEPSMDWGNPETATGFINQVTDRKDADTHFSTFRDAISDHTADQARSVFKPLMQSVSKLGYIGWNFFSDLNQSLGPLMVLGLIAGSILCIRQSPPLFLFFLIIVAGNATFFAGWKKESYLPSYLIAGLMTAVFLAWFFARLQSVQGGGFRWHRVALIGLAGLVFILPIKNFYRADRSGSYIGEMFLKRVFLSLDDRSLFVPGMSWFNFYYHNDVMRLRDDVSAIKAWDLLDPDPMSYLTPRRYPDLDFPDPDRYHLNTREGASAWVLELFERTRHRRPVLVEQNHILYKELGLGPSFKPNRNITVRYDPEGADFGPKTLDPAFAEFEHLLERDLGQRGLPFQPDWASRPAYYLKSFATYYHEVQRYTDERKALEMIRSFQGEVGPEWYFDMIDNLILDDRSGRARALLLKFQEAHPGDYRVDLAEGLLLRSEGNLERADNVLKNAVAGAPEAFRPRWELASIHRLQGETQQADKMLAEARQRIRNLSELNRFRRGFTS